MHINHRRGETRAFVWHREHRSRHQKTWYKSTHAGRLSVKRMFNRIHRARERDDLRHGREPDPRRNRVDLDWYW